MLFSERNLFPRFFTLAAAGLLFAALPAIAKSKAMPVQTALIENTGSTNTLGYQLQISSDGTVAKLFKTAIRVTTVIIKPIAARDAGKLFQDLNTAMPLSALPVRHGMRSASFGTETYITYKGQKSPDLTFASDPRTVALKADIDAITKAAHVGNVLRRPIVIRSTR